MITDVLKKTSEAIFGGDFAVAYSNSKLNKAKEALASEFQRNLAALEAEKTDTAAQFRAKLNTAAVSSEKSLRSFSEIAASSGLNGGACQKAEKARDYVLSNKLKSIESKGLEAAAKIEERKAKLEAQYISDLEKAEAEAEKEREKALEKANKRSGTATSNSNSNSNNNYGSAKALITKTKEDDEYKLSAQYEKLREDTLKKLGL